jgi:hypothetical protein
MLRRPTPISRTGRANRRGCVILLLGILAVLAALAAIGFKADPISEFNIAIPAIG